MSVNESKQAYAMVGMTRSIQDDVILYTQSHFTLRYHR